MSNTILLVGLVVFAFVVSHLVNRYAARFVTVSGAEYLVIGALIGPQLPPRLVTSDFLTDLAPLVSLLLGLIGFLVGLRAKSDLSSPRYALLGLLTSVAVLVSCASLALSLVTTLQIADDGVPLFSRPLLEMGRVEFDIYITKPQVWLAAALGAAATVSSSALLVAVGKSLNAKSHLYALLRSFAASSQWVAIVSLGIILALTRGAMHNTPWLSESWQWATGAAVLGIVSGLLFTLFIGKEHSPSRIFLATVGAVTFASGVGRSLGISPMFLNLIAGVTVGLISKQAFVLLDELDRLQHAIFVLLLIFAGALWSPVSGWQWIFPALYLLIRTIAKRAFTHVVAHWFTDVPPARIGTALLAQGTLAVAVAVDFSQRFPDYAPLVLTSVLIAAFISDIVAPRSVRSVLLDAEAAEPDQVALTPPPPAVITQQEAAL